MASAIGRKKTQKAQRSARFEPEGRKLRDGIGRFSSSAVSSRGETKPGYPCSSVFIRG
ncbi:MAG: hypothetical protein ACKPB0_07310 [Opitutaceae bacterium]